MTRRKPDLWLWGALAGGLAYPFLVFTFYDRWPSAVFLALALALVVLRFCGMRQRLGLGGSPLFWLCAAAGLGLLFGVNGLLAAKAYPVVMNLAAASLFGLSLRYPPPLIERLARLSEPDLSPAGVLYTRRVTWVWFVFLMGNMLVSVATLWAPLVYWTLWNGCVAYVLMGLLFAGEYVFRTRVRR